MQLIVYKTMKISKLVTKLEELKAVHGDLKVTFHDNYEGGSCDIESVVAVYPVKKSEWGVEDKTQPAVEIELI